MNSYTSSKNPIAVSQMFFGLLLVLGVVALGFFWICSGFSSPKLLITSCCVIFFIVSFFSIKIGLIVMALAMLFSPEIAIGSVGARAIIIRIEDILIPILIVASLARITVRRQFSFFVNTPLNLPVLLLICLSFLSTFRGAASGWVSILPASFYIFKTVEFFAIYFLVVNYVRQEKQIKIFLFFLLLTASLVALYTLKQVPSVDVFTTHRITAPFESSPQPGTIGGYLAFLIVIIFSMLLYEKKPFLKWTYSLLIGVLLIPFLFTLNRTSYMALLSGIVFIALIEKRKWLTFLLLALVISSPIWLPKSVKQRIAYTWTDSINPGREIGVDASFQERVYVYRKMWNTWKYSPVIGLGVTSWDIADSQYARTLHEIGILGLGIWFWIFRRLFRMSRWLFDTLEAGSMKGMVLGYRAGLIGLLIHGFGSITLYTTRIMEPFWFISGLMVSLYLIKVNQMSTSE